MPKIWVLSTILFCIPGFIAFMITRPSCHILEIHQTRQCLGEEELLLPFKKNFVKSPPQQLSNVTFCSKEESGRLTLDVGWATLATGLMQLALNHCDGIEIQVCSGAKCMPL